MDSQSTEAEVFISYSRRDYDQVRRIAQWLESAGVSVWMDTDEIDGGTNYGLEISRGIQACKVLMLMCSNASMQSRNVRQEIQLAWRYERPYMPMLLERINFPEQIEYWLEGWQWVEVLGAPSDQWAPKVTRALAQLGVSFSRLADGCAPPSSDVPAPGTGRVTGGLGGLREVASFTDRIWPIPAHKRPGNAKAGGVRGLGAPQDHVQHSHRIGSDVCLVIEAVRDGHLLLLDEGPEGIAYCLCPSSFAPSPFVTKGRHYLPQPGSRYESFKISGAPGREHLLAVITNEPLGLDWIPSDPRVPARVIDDADIETLLAKLRSIEPDSWTALATYFDITS